MLTYQIGALHSRQWGLYAVLLSFLTYAFVASARSISPDQFTALATTGCFYACHSSRIPRRRWRLAWLPILGMLGFASRGPIGFIIPAAVVCTYYLVHRE